MKVPALVLCLFALPVVAAPRTHHTQAAPKAPQGFRAEFLAQLEEVEEKIVGLAESTPADKFGWRPAGDIRSIAEVYMHIAGWNYYLSSFLGGPSRPHGADYEKSRTRKADVIAELKKSFDHLHATVNSANNLEKPVKMFGSQPTTYRGVMLTMLSHLHEHLGQSIAYARMNGVAPPWSR